MLNKSVWDAAWDEAAPEQRRTVRRWKAQKIVTWGCKLVGDQNHCHTCGDWFNSTSAFEKHRHRDLGLASIPRGRADHGTTSVPVRDRRPGIG